MVDNFPDSGWAVFPPEDAVSTWAGAAHRDAVRAVADPDLVEWHQCEGTWFVGLEALDNDALGRVSGSGPLTGRAVDFIDANCGGWPALHRAQVSVTYPGYPKPRTGETEAGFRYRVRRDAAHVDGLIGVGQPKRRFLQEPHQFILGLPLSDADMDAAPLVVWEGSHKIMARAFRQVMAGHDPQTLHLIDVTQAYQVARKEVFETCKCVTVHGGPGSAYLVHRMALHGVAPWAEGASAAAEGRMIAYFRPEMPGGIQQWLTKP